MSNYMPESLGYADLDGIAFELNRLEDAVIELRDRIRGLYPDNSYAPPTVDDYSDAVSEIEGAAKRLIKAADSIIP